MVMGYMHAVGHCLQRRGLHSKGGAIPRMEHAKRRSASTSLFLHHGTGDVSAAPKAVPNLVQIRPRVLLCKWVKYNEKFFKFIPFIRELIYRMAR